jgi:hypothetical protein
MSTKQIIKEKTSGTKFLALFDIMIAYETTYSCYVYRMENGFTYQKKDHSDKMYLLYLHFPLSYLRDYDNRNVIQLTDYQHHKTTSLNNAKKINNDNATLCPLTGTQTIVLLSHKKQNMNNIYPDMYNMINRDKW